MQGLNWLGQADRVRTIAEYFVKNITSIDLIYTIEKIKSIF